MASFSCVDEAVRVLASGPDHGQFLEAVHFIALYGTPETKQALLGALQKAMGPLPPPDVYDSQGHPGYSQKTLADYFGVSLPVMKRMVAETLKANGGGGVMNPDDLHAVH